MEITIGRRHGGAVGLLAVLALGGACLAYAAGLIGTLGQESYRVTNSGLATSTRSGGGVGLKRMLFFAGQTFHVDYAVEVRRGSFRIGILDTFAPIGDKPHFVESIRDSSAGEVSWRIPRTGIYSIYFEGSVLGDDPGPGYDVAYEVRWGVR